MPTLKKPELSNLTNGSIKPTQNQSPKNQAKPRPAILRLFRTFTIEYGDLWTKKFQGDDPDIHARQWEKRLARYPDKAIEKAALEWGAPFPPNVHEFAEFCEPYRPRPVQRDNTHGGFDVTNPDHTCHIEMCQQAAALSHSTRGGGPWFCREHFHRG